jgi:hypothetical protein
VGREIVGDEVDFPTRFHIGNYLPQKGDELGAGIALSGLAKDLSASGIKGRVRERVPWR